MGEPKSMVEQMDAIWLEADLTVAMRSLLRHSTDASSLTDEEALEAHRLAGDVIRAASDLRIDIVATHPALPAEHMAELARPLYGVEA